MHWKNRLIASTSRGSMQIKVYITYDKSISKDVLTKIKYSKLVNPRFKNLDIQQRTHNNNNYADEYPTWVNTFIRICLVLKRLYA